MWGINVYDKFIVFLNLPYTTLIINYPHISTIAFANIFAAAASVSRL